ncbi:MAG TPA: hypothetical protein VI279_13405 [Rhodocyclaceae bacterium]
MQEPDLESLIRIGKLRPVPCEPQVFDRLLRSGRQRLIDARLDGLSTESRFDLAYNAATALALAILSGQGYRAQRMPPFLALPYVVPMEPEIRRYLAQGHALASNHEHGEVDEALAGNLIQAALNLLAKAEGQVVSAARANH